MNKTLTAVSTSLAFIVAGCSSVPTPVVPNGLDRQPINSQAKIDDYKALTAEEASNYKERTALMREADSLKRQIAELQAVLLMMQMEKDSAPKTRSAPTKAAPSKIKAAVLQTVGDGGESIEVRNQAVIFRVTHPFGKTNFGPSRELQEKLLKAAHEAKHIYIRGRTDANYINPIDRNIAMQRALSARRFLLANGIDASKIRWSLLASGGHIADNKTAEGRSKNRRVEIETMDIDTAAFNGSSQPATKLGIAQ